MHSNQRCLLKGRLECNRFMTRNGVENAFGGRKAEGREKIQFMGDLPLSHIRTVFLIVDFYDRLTIIIFICQEIEKKILLSKFSL